MISTWHDKSLHEHNRISMYWLSVQLLLLPKLPCMRNGFQWDFNQLNEKPLRFIALTFSPFMPRGIVCYSVLWHQQRGVEEGFSCPHQTKQFSSNFSVSFHSFFFWNSNYLTESIRFFLNWHLNYNSILLVLIFLNN